MLQELSARLSKSIERKRLKEKLEKDLRSVDTEFAEVSARFRSLSTQLRKEKIDVEKLERISITTLFYSVLGSREQQLEKERQELLSAQLQYQQAQKQMDYLEYERNMLLQQLDELSGVDAEYESCLTEKELFIRKSNQALTSDLIEYAEQIANLDVSIQEITEAIDAGYDVVAGLQQVIKSLESAKSWGIWDMLGGGLLSTALKHSRVDDARKGIDSVEKRMSRFRRELADVQQQVQLQIDIEGLEAFADYFFDGLIFDWVVQAKINDSLIQAKRAKSKIAQTVKRLEEKKEIIQNQEHDLQEKRARILENN